MQDDVAERRVAVVPVRMPSAGAQVHFHVSLPRCGIAELNYRLTKIRAAFQVMKAGMQNQQGLSVQGRKPVAKQALVLPDGLQQFFGRRIGVLAQNRNQPRLDSPASVEVVLSERHLTFAFAWFEAQCQALQKLSWFISDTGLVNEMIPHLCPGRFGMVWKSPKHFGNGQGMGDEL